MSRSGYSGQGANRGASHGQSIEQGARCVPGWQERFESWRIDRNGLVQRENIWRDGRSPSAGGRGATHADDERRSTCAWSHWQRVTCADVCIVQRSRARSGPDRWIVPKSQCTTYERLSRWRTRTYTVCSISRVLELGSSSMEEHVCFREVDGGMHACLRNDHCWLRVASMPYVSQCHPLLVVVFYTSILEDLRGCLLHCVCTRGAPVFIPSVWKIQTPPWVQVFFLVAVSQ